MFSLCCCFFAQTAHWKFEITPQNKKHSALLLIVEFRLAIEFGIVKGKPGPQRLYLLVFVMIWLVFLVV